MTLSGFLCRLLRRRRFFAASLFLVVLPLNLQAERARAGDWSFETSLNERVDFYDKYPNLADSNGWVLGSTTDIFGDLIYKTHDSRFDLIADIAVVGYAGPGSDGLSNNILPRLETKYNKTGKVTDINLGAYYDFDYLPASDELDIDEEIIDTEDAIKHSYGANLSVARKLNVRNTVTLSSAVDNSTFDGEGTDNTRLDLSLRWDRRMTKRLDAYVDGGINWLVLEDEANTSRTVYNGGLGVTSRLSKRLTASLGGGINVVNSNKDDLLVPGQPTERDTSIGFSANASFQYALKTTLLALDASYGLEPGTLGDLQNRANVTLTWNETINERSSFSVTAKAQFSENLDDEENEATYGMTLSPVYSVALTDEWNFKAGYKFILRQNSDGTTSSNNVFVSLGRSFTPNP